MKTGVQMALLHRQRKLSKIGVAMFVVWILMLIGIDLIGGGW